MEQVRLGFIGTGGIARYHFSHLEKMEDVRISAVHDVVGEKAQEAADRFGADAYPSVQALLQEADIDAVYICVPPFAHGEAEWLAIERDLPLFVEKPVHLDLDDAGRIAQAVQDRGLISAVGYQGRYADIIDRLRAYLSDQQVGLVLGYWIGGMPGVSWWRRKDQSGGQAVEQTTHIFDLARYLFGEVAQVTAAARTGLMADVPQYSVEDASAVTLQFESGLIGTVFSGCFLGVSGRVGLTIYCKDAAIEYYHGSALKIVERHTTVESKVGNDIGFDEDRTFIEAVKSGDGAFIRSPYPDAVRSLAVTLAANEAMQTGATVRPAR